MAEHSDDQLLAETDKLVGRWECYAGDGIHGWDDRVIIFDKFGGQLTLQRAFTTEIDL